MFEIVRIGDRKFNVVYTVYNMVKCGLTSFAAYRGLASLQINRCNGIANMHIAGYRRITYYLQCQIVKLTYNIDIRFY